MVERCPDKTEVVGSIPTMRTMMENVLVLGLAFLLASAVLVVVQVVYVRKLQKLELDNLAKNLKDEFSAKIDKRAMDLQSYIEEAVESKFRNPRYRE